jgi:hypothetical protein
MQWLETGFVIITKINIINNLGHQTGFKTATPARISKDPRVDAFVPAWMRLKKSGILISPRLAVKRKNEPVRTIKDPIISRISITAPSL